MCLSRFCVAMVVAVIFLDAKAAVDAGAVTGAGSVAGFGGNFLAGVVGSGADADDDAMSGVGSVAAPLLA